jgi:hypothetical protein
MKIEGSGSISQRHGSAVPDSDADPHQNVMDPNHWLILFQNPQQLAFLSTAVPFILTRKSRELFPLLCEFSGEK